MRIPLLLIFLAFFVLVLEASAQTGSTEITPDTRLCWYQPFVRPGPSGTIVDFPFVVGKIPAPEDASSTCLFYATCNEVMRFKKTRSGGTTGVLIPPGGKHRRTVPTAVVAITDCNSYGARKKRNSPRVTRNKNDVEEATKTIGEFTYIHRRVEILSKGRGQRWQRISRGYKIQPGDTLRTGPRGRARIQVGAKRDLNNINIGSNSEIVLTSKFLEGPKEPTTYFTLITGALRSFVRKILPDSFREPLKIRSSPTARLHIRTPNALIEKIGTDFAVNYEPNTKVTSVFLDHGKVNIKSGGRQVTLKPRTSLKIVNGRIGQPRRMSQSNWNDLVLQTDAQDEVAGLEFPGPEEPDMPFEFDPSVAGSNDRWAAREMVNLLLTSMKNNDQSTLLGVTGGIMRSTYVDLIRKRGSLKAILDGSGLRPASWQHECSVCTNAGRFCMASVIITTARTGKASRFIFTFENEKVTDGRSAQGETQRKFEALKPVCGEEDSF